MSFLDNKTCLNCHYADGGSCHRFPPQWASWPNDNQHPIMYQPYANFPNVSPNEWCGEWKEAKL